MKLYSPFFILIFLCLFSCTDKNQDFSNQKNSPKDSVSTYISFSTKDSLSSMKRLHFSDKAYEFALKNNKPQDISMAFFNKVDNILYLYPDSSEVYFKKSYNFVKKYNEEYNMARQSGQIAYYYDFIKIDLDSSYFHYNRASKYYKKINDSLRTGYNLMMLANIDLMFNDYNEADIKATEAQKFLKNQNYPFYDVALYNILARNYSAQKNYAKAIENYEKAVLISEDSLAINTLKNNIGHIKVLEQKYDDAISMFLAVLNSKIVQNTPEAKARTLDNLGFAYFKKDSKQGLDYMLQGLKIRDSLKAESGIITSNIRLSQYYSDKNAGLSKQYAQNAYTVATRVKSVDERLEALKLLRTQSFSKKETDLFFDNYLRINDSIQNVRQNAKNQFANFRYNSEKDRADAAEKTVEIEKVKGRNEILGTLLIAFLLLGIPFFLFKQYKNKQEKRLEAYRTETRLAKKVHDELANDIYNAMIFADTQDLSSLDKKEKLVNVLDNVYSRSRDISRENNSIETGKLFLPELKEMLSGYKSPKTNVILNGFDDIHWDGIIDAKKIVAHRVLQEIMVNMKKHSGASLVLLSIKKNQKKIEINYSDNGVGIGADKIIYKNGLSNAETRIQSIRGNITFDSNPQKGLKIIIVFPV